MDKDIQFWMIDFEGTLTDNKWRQHLITGRDKDWRTYFKGLEHDDPIEPIKDLICLLAISRHRVMVYSTRHPNKYEMEKRWMGWQNLSSIDFIQRTPGHIKIVGADLLRQWVEEYKPTHLVDDRDVNRGAIADLVPNVYSPQELLEDGKLQDRWMRG